MLSAFFEDFVAGFIRHPSLKLKYTVALLEISNSPSWRHRFSVAETKMQARITFLAFTKLE